MRRTHAVLIILLFGNLLAGCTSGGTWRPDTPPRPTDPSVGRWEIIVSAYVQYDDKGTGWKYVRIPISIQNRTNRFMHALISVAGATLYTTQMKSTDATSSSYPVQLCETQGFNTTQTTEINYTSAGPFPPGILLSGIYRNDAVSSYYFQARIPNASTPVSLSIPGYAGSIPLSNGPVQAFNTSNFSSRSMNPSLPISISGKATLVVNTIASMRQVPNSYNHIAHDRISITFTITSTNSANDSSVDLRATAIGDKGVLGSPLYDEVIGCAKPPFTIGPSMPMTRTLCAIVPLDSRNVRVILTGDVNEVYVPGF